MRTNIYRASLYLSLSSLMAIGRPRGDVRPLSDADLARRRL
jgi:hypothetical protein